MLVVDENIRQDETMVSEGRADDEKTIRAEREYSDSTKDVEGARSLASDTSIRLQVSNQDAEFALEDEAVSGLQVRQCLLRESTTRLLRPASSHKKSSQESKAHAMEVGECGRKIEGKAFEEPGA